jgi:hypothetical protein
MASPIESIGFMHGLHNYPKLPKRDGGSGIRRIRALLFFEDAEGFAGEIRLNFFVDDSRFPDKGLITTETFFEVLS